MRNFYHLTNAEKAISAEIGILSHYVELPRYQTDPRIINCGIWACNTKYINGEEYNGRSGGCGYEWENTILSTIGETLERYACAFYNTDEMIYSSFANLNKYAINPMEFALFHEHQLEKENYPIAKFNENVEVSWFPCIDLTDDRETFVPGQFIYLPFSKDFNFLTVNTSTGLASHTNIHKAILNAIYECIERDCFVISWMNKIYREKIFISDDIQNYLNKIYPENYEWHFFDINYDLGVPTVFGICFGETEYGKFVAVGSATRATYADALKKVIQEIGQAVPYFRWVMGEKGSWKPIDNYDDLLSFEDHSVFYLKKPEIWDEVFGPWIHAPETKSIAFHEENNIDDKNEIKRVLKIFKNKNMNVLFKDLTTVDIDQLGFKSVKIFIPQLIQMSGAYKFYFNGSTRLMEVPTELGYKTLTFEELNKFPHPFP